MHVHEPRRDEKADAAARLKARQAAETGPAATALALQRSIGNQGTSAVIQRAKLDFVHSAWHTVSGHRRQERKQLDHGSGLALNAKKIKDHEIDDKGQLRINPVWIPLKNLTGEILDQSPPGAKWQYAVTPSGDIFFGSEDITSIIGSEQIDKIYEGMAKVYDGRDEEHPKLTREELVKKMMEMGHPTIAAAFKKKGATKNAPKARVSGEMHLEDGVWTLNDKSGRYMAEKVRGKLDHADLERWMSGVADRISKQTGKKINYRIVKHAAK